MPTSTTCTSPMSSRASKGTHINENAVTGEDFRGGIGGSNNGVATQIMDKDNPTHWFRLEPHDITGAGTTNPKNRAQTYTNTDTGKRDYFIEDPTENVASGTVNSDVNAEFLDIGANGNNKVYFVDGNLWAANAPTYTFKFKHAYPGMKVTVVVKGNI